MQRQLLERIIELLEHNTAVNAHSLQQQMNLGWDGWIVIGVAFVTLFVAVLSLVTSLQMKKLQENSDKRLKAIEKRNAPYLLLLATTAIVSSIDSRLYVFCRIINIGNSAARISNVTISSFKNQKTSPEITSVMSSLTGSNLAPNKIPSTSSLEKHVYPVLPMQQLDFAIVVSVSSDRLSWDYQQFHFQLAYGGDKPFELGVPNAQKVDHISVNESKFFDISSVVVDGALKSILPINPHVKLSNVMMMAITDHYPMPPSDTTPKEETT